MFRTPRKGSTFYRRRGGADGAGSSKSGHGSKGSSSAFQNPLDELTYCLDRLEELVYNTNYSIHYNDGKPAFTATSARKSLVNAFRSRRRLLSTTTSDQKDKDTDASASKSNDETANTSDAESLPNSSANNDEDTPDAGTVNSPAPPRAKFIPPCPQDEEEMIELLRRTAELVVMGEQAGAKILAGQRPDDEDAQSHIALFESFFERNALEMIVNIVTGASYSQPVAVKQPTSIVESNATDSTHSSSSSIVLDPESTETFNNSTHNNRDTKDDKVNDDQPDDEKAAAKTTGDTDVESKHAGDSANELKRNAQSSAHRTTLLPPIEIATQAIQSVSILIQNVSRATSLYFLLSNNYINNLINLPLELYALAEHLRRHGPSETVLISTTALNSSPEISELTTHFVTFLKSLALRMNAETLQFFLTYPGERGEADETHTSGTTTSSDNMVASSAHFSSQNDLDVQDLIISTTDSQDEDHDMPLDELKASRQKKKETVAAVSKPVVVATVEVEFPLYARALEYCSSHQDSFVRVTAMNICLNTLRLATTIPPEEQEEPITIDTNGDYSSGMQQQQGALPLRERLAVAQHVCCPSRVEGLVSPIFTKLAQLWGVVEEQIRDIDMLREGKRSTEEEDDGIPRIKSAKMEKAKEEAKRKRYTDTLRDSVADLQDELLLLEDVFRVGLTSLNEQVIEMMLATFVYPLLLQPLLLFMQRFTNPNSEEARRLTELYMVDVLAKGATTSPEMTEDVDEQQEGRIAEAAPAKTALFTLTAVFQLLSNQPLMRLLLTALFHPMTPDSSGETMIAALPDVAGKGVNGKVLIRTDTFQTGDSSRRIGMEPSPYSFGNVTGEKRTRKPKRKSVVEDDGHGECVFVLSPALTEVLEGQVGDVSLIAKTRVNPYRRAVLKCLSAGPKMSNLRQLAVLLFDAIVQRFEPKFLSNLVFGSQLKSFVSDDVPLDEQHLDSRRAHIINSRGMGGRGHLTRHPMGSGQHYADFTNEVIAALSYSVMNVSTNYKGLWKVVFDGIAAHSLMWVAKENREAMRLASKLIEHRRRLASVFISEIPHVIESIIEIEGRSEANQNEHDLDQDTRIGLHADRMFFEVAPSKRFSVVGELLKLKETVGKTDRDEYSVSVALASKFDDLSVRMCNFGRLQFSEDAHETTHQIAATSAMAYVQIDGLSVFLKELAATNANALNGGSTAFAITRNGIVVSTKLASGTDVNRSIFSPISSKICTNLLRLEDNPGDRDAPKPGAVVGLVGRTAIPCVCEVPEESTTLLADEAASVVADGVKWQSLYLVFLGRYMILAEPERGGSGGNGRIVTCCQLNMMSIERDSLPPAGNSSPARRLLATHLSVDPTPPGLFVPTPSGGRKQSAVEFGPFLRLMHHESAIDLWFEDENAAEHAFRIMSVKLLKSRAKRGNRLREKLQEDL